MIVYPSAEDDHDEIDSGSEKDRYEEVEDER